MAQFSIPTAGRFALQAMPIPPLLHYRVVAKGKEVASFTCGEKVAEKLLHVFRAQFQSQTPIRIHLLPPSQPIKQKYTVLP